jgi:hypothetical protein
LVEPLAFVKHAGLGVGKPQVGQHLAFGLLVISVFLAGNTDFWRNDPFRQTSPPRPGQNLFGSNRIVIRWPKKSCQIARFR